MPGAFNYIYLYSCFLLFFLGRYDLKFPVRGSWTAYEPPMSNSRKNLDCPFFTEGRIAILLSYVVCIFGTFHLAFHGLPKKAARDPGVDNGCPRFLLMFMGSLSASRGRDEMSKILGWYEANPNPCVLLKSSIGMRLASCSGKLAFHMTRFKHVEDIQVNTSVSTLWNKLMLNRFQVWSMPPCTSPQISMFPICRRWNLICKGLRLWCLGRCSWTSWWKARAECHGLIVAWIRLAGATMKWAMMSELDDDNDDACKDTSLYLQLPQVATGTYTKFVRSRLLGIWVF